MALITSRSEGGLDPIDQSRLRALIVEQAAEPRVAAMLAAPSGVTPDLYSHGDFRLHLEAAVTGRFGPEGTDPRPAVIDLYRRNTNTFNSAGLYFAVSAHRQARSAQAAGDLAEHLIETGLPRPEAEAFAQAVQTEFIPGLHGLAAVETPFAYLRGDAEDRFFEFAAAWAADAGDYGLPVWDAATGETIESEQLREHVLDWAEQFWQPEPGVGLDHLLGWTTPELGRAVLGIDDSGDRSRLPLTLRTPHDPAAPVPSWHQVTPADPPAWGHLPEVDALAAAAANVLAFDQTDVEWATERARALAATPAMAQILSRADDLHQVHMEVTNAIRRDLHAGLAAAGKQTAAALFEYVPSDAAAAALIDTALAYALAHLRPDLAPARPAAAFAAERSAPRPLTAPTAEAIAAVRARLRLDAAGNPRDIAVADTYLEVVLERLTAADPERAAIGEALAIAVDADPTHELFAEPSPDRYAAWTDLVEALGRARLGPRGWETPLVGPVWAAEGAALRAASFWVAAAHTRDEAIADLRDFLANRLSGALPGHPGASVDFIDIIAEFVAHPDLGRAVADGEDPFGEGWSTHYAALRQELTEHAAVRGRAALVEVFDLQAAPDRTAWHTAQALRDGIRDWAQAYWRPDPGSHPDFAAALAALPEPDRERILAAAESRQSAHAALPEPTAQTEEASTEQERNTAPAPEAEALEGAAEPTESTAAPEQPDTAAMADIAASVPASSADDADERHQPARAAAPPHSEPDAATAEPEEEATAARPAPAAADPAPAPVVSPGQMDRILTDRVGNPINPEFTGKLLDAALDAAGFTGASKEDLRRAIVQATWVSTVGDLFTQPHPDRYAAFVNVLHDRVDFHFGGGLRTDPALLTAWEAAGPQLWPAAFWHASAQQRDEALGSELQRAYNYLAFSGPDTPSGVDDRLLRDMLNVVENFVRDRYTTGAAVAVGTDPTAPDWREGEFASRVLDKLTGWTRRDTLQAAFGLGEGGTVAWAEGRTLREEVQDWVQRYWQADEGSQPELAAELARLARAVPDLRERLGLPAPAPTARRAESASPASATAPVERAPVDAAEAEADSAPTAEPTSQGEPTDEHERDPRSDAPDGPVAEADADRPPAAAPGPRFRPSGQADLARPGNPAARAKANMEALRALRQIQSEDRPATPEEQQVLARWSGWGAASQVFDEKREEFAELRTELADLLSEEEYRAARATVLNAHYTDAAYVSAIWDALGDLGFTGGQVLEPGCGSGNFIGLAPEGAAMTGVELDPTTASIAQLLYPDADVLSASFAKIDAARDSFDCAVGNVPFHDSVMVDPSYNPHNFSLHNAFIVKSLQLVRPGGMVAVLTSSYTMDAVNPAVRREIAAMADLVGAVRLPNRAHRAAAGTDALTDLLVFRRRAEGAAPAPGAEGWERAVPFHEDGTGPRYNTYFADHPEHVLGELTLASNMHASETITVTGEADPAAVAAALRGALAGITAAAAEQGLAMSERTEAAPAPAAAVATHTVTPPERYLREAAKPGTFEMWQQGAWRPHQVPKSQVKELQALLGIKETVIALLDAEASSIEDTPEMDQLRAELNDRYDAYLSKHGPINRVKRTPRYAKDPETKEFLRDAETGERVPLVDPETGAQKYTQRSPGQGGFKSDSHAFVVRALELYDPATGLAAKQAIFSERVIVRQVAPRGAETPADALAISLDRTAGVDLDLIADLLGIEAAEALEVLGDLVFTDPVEGTLVTAAEYCSGDIRVKLDLARAAAEGDAAFAQNVAALEAVCPADLGPGEIVPRLGAVWMPAADVQEFLRGILSDPKLTVEHAGGSTWTVTNARKSGPAATAQWGTPKMPASEIAAHLLTGRPIRLTKEDKDGKRIYDQSATDRARAKAEAMAEAFTAWVWTDPDRTDRLCDLYNRSFNSLVPRRYTGEHLTLPGLSAFYKLRPHQLAAVERMINEPSTGLWHEVGAGKTLEMIVGSMELKRLGMAHKPCITVPNHMLAQFTNEFMDAYPQAQLLAAGTEDLAGEGRREFIARAATGNWDCIILTHSAFESIGLSPETQIEYFEHEKSVMAAKLVEASERHTIKEIEGSIARLESRIDKYKAAVKSKAVDSLTFEQTGIDFVSVDEAHLFKNLRRASVIESMTIRGADRASDLDMKLHYLRSIGRSHVCALATATPLPNSMGEAHTMLRYLRPDLLAKQGLTEFDGWANTYGELVTQVEIAPEGGMREKTRFAKFVNVPELMRTIHVAADIKLAADLDLPVPEHAPRASDGERAPEIVAIPATAAMTDYMADIMRRAEKIRGGNVDPRDDNMLRIASDGRSAEADVRMVGLDPEDEPQKADVAADKIVEIWAEHRDRVYADPTTGEPHPVPGALQLVFCDMGTPTGKGWNLYGQLRKNLAARGMDPARIRFIHEAKNDKEKGELFAAARAGGIDVLIGSTQKMGVGTNVQTRVAAMHQLDCPWRPADVTQRVGRGIRQGNQHTEVRELRYVVEGGFGGYMWQTVARKSQFINQVMRGDMGVREIEDIDEATLSYEEIKAIAVGDPRLLEHANLRSAVAKLESAQRAHEAGLRHLEQQIVNDQENITIHEKLLAAFDAAIPRVVDTKGKAFAATIAGRKYTEFTAATEQLRAQLHQVFSAKLASGTTRSLGSFGGFELQAAVTGTGSLRLELEGAPQTGVTITTETIANAQPLTALRNALGKLDANRAAAQAKLDQLHTDIEQAQAQLGAPFPKLGELETARIQFEALDVLIALEAQGRLPRTGGSAPAAAAVTPPANAPLPEGGIRFTYDTAAGYLEVTGVTEGWLGEEAFEHVTGELDRGGYEQRGDPDEGRWSLMLSPEARNPATDRTAAGRRFEEQFRVPVQILQDGNAAYQTPPEKHPMPQVTDQPTGYARLDFRGGYHDWNVLDGVTAAHLGVDEADLDRIGDDLTALGWTEDSHIAGRWSRKEFINGSYEAEARPLEAVLGRPVQVAVDNQTRYTPAPTVDLYHQAPPSGVVRMAVHATESATHITVTGVDAARLGTDRYERIRSGLEGSEFKQLPGLEGVWERAGQADPDKLQATDPDGPHLERLFAGPVEIYHQGQLRYQSSAAINGPAAPDGRAAARSAAAALGATATSVPKTTAAVAAEVPEADRAR